MITTGSKSNSAYETCVYQPTRSTRNLFRRMVQVLPNGPLLDYKQAFGERELKAPNAAGTLGAGLPPRPARKTVTHLCPLATHVRR